MLEVDHTVHLTLTGPLKFPGVGFRLGTRADFAVPAAWQPPVHMIAPKLDRDDGSPCAGRDCFYESAEQCRDTPRSLFIGTVDLLSYGNIRWDLTIRRGAWMVVADGWLGAARE